MSGKVKIVIIAVVVLLLIFILTSSSNAASTASTNRFNQPMSKEDEFKLWLLRQIESSTNAYVSRGDNTQPLGDYSFVRFGAMYVADGRHIYLQPDGKWKPGGSPVTDVFGSKVGRGSFGNLCNYIKWQLGNKALEYGEENINKWTNDVMKKILPEASSDGPVTGYAGSILQSIKISDVISLVKTAIKAYSTGGGSLLADFTIG